MKLFLLKSLRVRLILLVLIAVFPAWGVIAYTASEQKRLAVDEIQRNVLQLTQFSAHEEEQALQGTRQILIGWIHGYADRRKCHRIGASAGSRATARSMA
jgi:hypothetical protein